MMNLGNEILSQGMEHVPVGAMAGVGLPAVAAIAVLKPGTIVHKGEVALREHGGSPYRTHNRFWLPWSKVKKGDFIKVYTKKGLKVHLPVLHGVTKVSVQDMIIPYDPADPTVVDDPDSGQYNVFPTFTCGVIPPYDIKGRPIDHTADYGAEYGELLARAIYRVSGEAERRERAKAICTQGLGNILRENGKVSDADARDIKPKLQEYCGEALLNYGMELRDFNMNPPWQTAADKIADAIERTRNVPFGMLTSDNPAFTGMPS